MRMAAHPILDVGRIRNHAAWRGTTPCSTRRQYLINCTVAIYALVAMSGGRGTAVIISCLISIGLLLVVLREWIPRRGLEGGLEAKTEEIEDVVRRWRSGR